MKRILLILSLSGSLQLLNSCVGNSESELWNTLPGDNPVPVLIRTSGTLTYEKCKDSVEAKVVCLNWPWREMTVTWPDDAPRIGHADMEILEEKWLGGGRQVARVFANGKTVYDATICEIHRVPMTREVVGSFNVGSKPDRYLAASQKAFRHDGMGYYLDGYGCASGLPQRDWRCPACYETAERWIKRQGISE